MLGCHNQLFSGGAGDIVANVFVLGQRFDFVTFGNTDTIPTKSSVNEKGVPVDLDTVANSRHTTGMFGAGYLEMIARQMTADLRAIRDSVAPGASARLKTKGVDLGTLSRDGSGGWDVSKVEGYRP